MNSCKVLQIRYASVERLLERLTDLRFLSIDFLNTFLHSYRVFTTAIVVLDKLITIYKKPISAIPARWVKLTLLDHRPSRPGRALAEALSQEPGQGGCGPYSSQTTKGVRICISKTAVRMKKTSSRSFLLPCPFP
jgi:hypothetical protein